jgi:hypothetical protein
VATLLTTSRMSPELQARIDDAVRGRRRSITRDAAQGGRSLRFAAVARLCAPLVVAALAALLVSSRHRERLELERARASLLEAVQLQSASLSADDRGKVVTIESWLTRLSGSYEGDLVADELRPSGAFATLLGHPVVYVRGPTASLASAATIAQAAALSFEDAFVRCLMDPPASRSEKAMLAKVRAPGSGMHDVYRLEEAEAVSPLLQPQWVEKVRLAPEQGSLASLRREFEKAPFERGKKALEAGVLVAVMDESNRGGGPTELDGERAHEVRVAIVDLVASTVLLRTRKRVDPAWISEARRSEYAGALDACTSAIDVRERATGQVTAPVPPAR